MKQKKKIFFTDLDETLLTKEKNMTPATVEAIAKLIEKGHYVALTSGRPLDSVMEARRLLPISDRGLFYIANNGGQIIDAGTMEIISEIRMTTEEVLYLFREAEKAGIHIQTYTDTAIVAKKQTPELDFYQKTIHMPSLITDDIAGALPLPPFKCLSLSFGGREKIKAFRDTLLPWAKGHVSLICSTDTVLEMFPSDSGKGAALRRLAGYLDIPVSDTVSAGDQDNDISMLQAAGVGIAMCNGSERARAAADVVTRTDNNHDGLVPLLNELFALSE